MQELDKLEKLINVDGCTEVLRRVDGPVKPIDRRNATYVFTIKIIEAEDLKACDPSGTSDPYVVLVDEHQKRLAKTRIIMRNLNPRWDESVDVKAQGPVNIIATIWDYDTFGDHDFVGRTSLKLDPVYFGDYLPREFWLDLDTQGRLLLRVSMEGERDDIQFYFGKAFRHLKRTERDMVRRVTDKVRGSRLTDTDSSSPTPKPGRTHLTVAYFHTYIARHPHQCLPIPGGAPKPPEPGHCHPGGSSVEDVEDAQGAAADAGGHRQRVAVAVHVL